MSVVARVALVDDRSSASNPGGLAVQPWRFAGHFPLWPCAFGIGLLAAIAGTVAKPGLWPLAVLFLVLNGLFWTRVKLRFRHGCVNPATVLSTSPFTLAVFTDLTTGNGSYPVIKILRHPAPKGMQLRVGDKCATVAMYTGSGNAGHWETFSPILADCATNNRLAIERVLQSIPAGEWLQLEEGLKKIPQPLKLGQYPLGLLS
jgi:hypothetical protein